MAVIQIERLSAMDIDANADRLAEILQACVAGGASIGFIAPFGLGDARAFWLETIRPEVAAGGRRLLAGRVDGEIAGVAQLVLSMPANQRHRADVAKVLTHPAFRRRGVARRLMTALEAEAIDTGRTLLVLDTRSGDPSERLYASLGYRKFGEIPGFARHPVEVRFEDATFMFKTIS